MPFRHRGRRAGTVMLHQRTTSWIAFSLLNGTGDLKYVIAVSQSLLSFSSLNNSKKNTKNCDLLMKFGDIGLVQWQCAHKQLLLTFAKYSVRESKLFSCCSCFGQQVSLLQLNFQHINNIKCTISHHSLTSSVTFLCNTQMQQLVCLLVVILQL